MATASPVFTRLPGGWGSHSRASDAGEYLYFRKPHAVRNVLHTPSFESAGPHGPHQRVAIRPGDGGTRKQHVPRRLA